jgi:sugar lactone lactonase YvrE
MQISSLRESSVGHAQFAVLLASALLASTNAALAQTVVEPGWTLIRTVSFDNPVAARLHPFDGRIYVARREGTANGLYRISAEGFPTLLASGPDLAGVCIDRNSGAIFHADSLAGIIYRTDFGATGRTTWVSGFHAGDDDPAGMAIAPPDYRGGVVPPGSALVADFGFNGPDEIWRWSPAVAEGDVALHTDDGTLVDAYDLAIARDRIWIVDTGGAAVGTIYEVGAGGALTPLPTSAPIAEPTSIAVDPRGGLLVTDSSTGRILRVDPTTGAVSEVITGITFASPWPALEVTADGTTLVVSAFGADTIFLFARCDATGFPELDCDGNGIVDTCDLAAGTASDCNRNGRPDACDLADGTSPDCNGDGVPDDCPQCPPVEVVFIMDTSTSMNDEAAALCAGLPQVAASLSAAGLAVTTTTLGICDLPGGAYACLENTVIALLGSAVPGNPPAEIAVLGACPGGNEVCQEDWGRATAVVAGLFPWADEGESVRVVIPITDEGPWCGDPSSGNDQLSISHAISVANASGVFVSPIIGSGASAAVLALAEQLAAATGGETFSSTKPSIDIAESIVSQVLAACARQPRCAIGDINCDGAVDATDLSLLLGDWNASGTPADINCNGQVDSADLAILLGAWSA